LLNVTAIALNQDIQFAPAKRNHKKLARRFRKKFHLGHVLLSARRETLRAWTQTQSLQLACARELQCSVFRLARCKTTSGLSGFPLGKSAVAQWSWFGILNCFFAKISRRQHECAESRSSVIA
jgi:hypothetical protein